MSTLAKLAIAAIVAFFVIGGLGVAGVYYAVHRIKQKVHAVSAGLLGPDSSSRSSIDGGAEGNVCRLLSKEDVGRAIGVKILRAEPGDDSCSYIAQGDQAEMTAKHATAMAAGRGADQKQQQMIESFAGAIFKNAENEPGRTPPEHKGEVPVLVFSIDRHAAETQMDLNDKVLGVFGPSGAQNIAGIGDQAFVSGESMLMVRKGSALIRIMYMTCPCNTDAVKPLARKIADAI